MEEAELIQTLPAKVVPVELPAIPPRPVWDDQLEALRIQIGDFQCLDEADFARGKSFGKAVVNLRGQIQNGYKEVKQAIDAIKAPVLDLEKADIAKITALQEAVDTPSLGWMREQKRKAEEAAALERKEAAERDAAKRTEEAEMARAWGDEEEAKKIEESPVVHARPSTPAPTFTYRAGARVNPKPKARIVNPSQVGRAFCQPAPPLINAKVSSYFAQIKNPTQAQMDELAKEIGGIVIELEG